MTAEEDILRLCGPCRHFDMALTGAHRCHLDLPLRDGVLRPECEAFAPFALGEGSQFLQSDCCAHHAEAGHAHAPEP